MGQSILGARRLEIRQAFFQAALVFTAYYLAGKLGQATTEIRSSNIGPVWPAYGVALAAVVRCGYRIWPVLLGAAFLVAAQSGVPALTALGQAGGSVLAALVGCFLLKFVDFDAAMSRLRDVLSLILLGGLVSPLASSAVGILVLKVSGLEAYSGLASAWFVYWLGDATGVLLITPLALAGPALLKSASRVRVAEFGALLTLLTFASLLVFAVSLHVPALLLLPFVIWASIRFGVGGSAVSSVIVAVIATLATALGKGPFSQSTTFVNAMLLDVFFATLCVSGLMLSSLIAEREKAEAERERLIREQASLEARLRLAAIVESSEDAIIGQDVHGIVTDWNVGAAALYGYNESEAIGAVFSRLVRPDIAKRDPSFRNMSNRVRRYETTHLRKDGTPIEISLTMSPILDAAGRITGASAIAHDITERQRAANALRESEDNLRMILNSAAEGIFGVDSEGRCTFCNEATLRLLGYDSDDALLGKDMHELIHHSHADGTAYPKEECQHLALALLTSQGYHIEDDVLWRADGSSFHAEIWIQSQRRADHAVGAVVAFSDITQRLRSEENAATLRDELAHLSRVGMLGALSGTLAHEINQPLAAVGINTESALLLLNEEPMRLQDLRETLTDIREDNRRAGEVLQHMRTLLKKNRGDLGDVEVNSTVGDVVKLVRSNALRRGVTIDVELSPWMRPILGDRVQVQQVILNLLMNACDAVESNAKGARRVGLKTVPRKDAMIIEVQDNGAGISDEELQHIFEPFYTTKHEGLGLGLAICQSIVAAHGGALDAVRNPSGGMTFSVTFLIGQLTADSIGKSAAARQTGLSAV